jgi:uncharacterized protein YjbI with pentapeptide repeats
MPPLIPMLKERVSPIWKSATLQFERGWQWLTRPRNPINWKTVRTRANSWLLRPRSIASRAPAVVIFAVVLFGIIPWLWQIYSTRFPAIIPLGAGIGGAIVAWAALTQAATARRRHEAQTGAEVQRRITENFTRATDQLGSDKTEVRLGGIYTLDRISRESPDDYWTVMETLCAFVRERTRRRAPEEATSETVARYYQVSEAFQCRSTPPTDIAAVMAVIVRRDEKNRRRERENGHQWRLDLREADLRKVNLFSPSIADFQSSDLSGADLSEATLVHVNLSGAHLRRANLSGADLWASDLHGADFSGADLSNTALATADLSFADLTGADLSGADLRGTDLRRAKGLLEEQLAETTGDALTELSADVLRPTCWTAA